MKFLLLLGLAAIVVPPTCIGWSSRPRPTSQETLRVSASARTPAATQT
jgi:hypothetical protein